jgi:hypothetical protein
MPFKYGKVETTISEMFSVLMRGSQSLANKLFELKQSPDFNISQNLIIKELLPIFANNATDEVDNIKLFRNKMDTYKNDVLIESVNNLLDYAKATGNIELESFIYNLTMFTILQSGLQSSTINYTKILPAHLYSKFINQLLKTYQSSDIELDYDLIWQQFHQNNKFDRNLIKKPKFAKKDTGTNNILLDPDYSDAEYEFIIQSMPKMGVNSDKINALSKFKKGYKAFDYWIYKRVGYTLDSKGKKYALYTPIIPLGDGRNYTETSMRNILKSNIGKNNVVTSEGFKQRTTYKNESSRPAVTSQVKKSSKPASKTEQRLELIDRMKKMIEGLPMFDDLSEAANEPNMSESSSSKNVSASKIIFEEDKSTNYQNRTKKNANADVTIAIAVDFKTYGEIATKKFVQENGKKYNPVDVSSSLTVKSKDVENIVNILNSVNKKSVSLNIAGNGIYTLKTKKYTQKQVDDYAYRLLKAVLESPKLKVKIESVVTGGQSGFDEAGAKAAIKLGLPTKILAPKGYKFRNINNFDISDEKRFKERFKERFTDKSVEGYGFDSVSITKEKYTRELVRKNQDTAYVYTENNYSITAFPDKEGDGTAIIRPELNAYPIVTKKKYNYNTKENVDYSNTDADFEEFNSVNTELINNIKQSGKSKVVFPDGFATNAAKLPTRFALWLQKELYDNFGLVTELNKTKDGLISTSVTKKADVQEEKTLKLMDGNTYPISEIDSKMLKSLGYTPIQITNITNSLYTQIKTNSGKTLTEINISKQEWDSISTEEKNKIKECY